MSMHRELLNTNLGISQLIPDKLVVKMLESDSHLPKNCLICFSENPLKMMTNSFYFILKALYVLKIFKQLS